LNGTSLNGDGTNGRELNGNSLNGAQGPGSPTTSDEPMTVRTITLPSGKVITLR
jgi:hypothetical protein